MFWSFVPPIRVSKFICIELVVRRCWHYNVFSTCSLITYRQWHVWMDLTVTHTHPLLVQFIRDPPSIKHRNNLVCDLACFVVLTPVTISSAYLCGSGVQHYAQWPDSWQVQGLYALTICLVFMYLTWLVVSTTRLLIACSPFVTHCANPHNWC